MGEGGGGRVSRRSRRATVSPYLVRPPRTAALRAGQRRPDTPLTSCSVLKGSAATGKKQRRKCDDEAANICLQSWRTRPCKTQTDTQTQTDRQTGRDSPLPLHNTQRAAKCQSRPVIKHKSPPPRPRTTPPKKTHLAACLCSKVATHWVIILLVFNNEGTQSFLPHAHPFDLHCFHPAAVLLISVATWEAPGTDVNRGVHSLNLWGPFKV